MGYPYFVRATKGKTKLSQGIGTETLDSARRIAARFITFGWKDITVVDDQGRLIAIGK